MFDVGFWELILLFGIGLAVLGPERMPKLAAQIGRWVGQARGMASQLTSQIRDEIEPINKVMDTDFSARRPEPGAKTTSANTSTKTTSTNSSTKTTNESTDKDS
jgi:sec-independent protein translocase protein TatB